MNHFIERASQLLDSAESASARGEACSELTVLIGHDGALNLIAHSDWSLDALALNRGAKAAYRITTSGGRLSVEGRQGPHRCLLESTTPSATARLLLR